MQKLAVGAPDVQHGNAIEGGSVYVFEGTNWAQTAALTHVAPENFALSHFGSAVAIELHSLLVGIPKAYTSSCPNLPRCGTVQEFADDFGNGWSFASVEHPDDGNLDGNPPGAQQGMAFGAAVAYGFDGMIAIGAPDTDGHPATGGMAEDVGLVGLRLAGPGGSPLGELRPEPITAAQLDEGHFGASVDFNHDTLAVGYPGAGTVAGGPTGEVWLYQRLPNSIFADGFD